MEKIPYKYVLHAQKAPILTHHGGMLDPFKNTIQEIWGKLSLTPEESM